MTQQQQMTGGFFNLRYGRDDNTVKREVKSFLFKHNMDFLCYQEGADYFRVLRDIADYECFATREYRGGTESGILVHRDHVVSNVSYKSFGDGWKTLRGGTHAPVTFPRVTIDKWLRVGSIHLPTPSVWRDGGLEAPPERLDDYMATARKIKRFMELPGNKTRLVVGDWNEPPTTMGPWSPGWIAAQTGSTIAFPLSRAGHGRIDYAMVNGGAIANMRKDLELPEGSDHEPGVFTVTR
jgi:hypothetical protein